MTIPKNEIKQAKKIIKDNQNPVKTLIYHDTDFPKSRNISFIPIMINGIEEPDFSPFRGLGIGKTDDLTDYNSRFFTV